MSIHDEQDRKLPKTCKHGNSLKKPCAECKALPPISLRELRAAASGDIGKIVAAA